MGKLREQMKDDLVLRGFSVHTQRNYLRCVREFAKYFKRSPAEMGEHSCSILLGSARSLLGSIVCMYRL
jgi:hypothetical protein